MPLWARNDYVPRVNSFEEFIESYDYSKLWDGHKDLEKIDEWLIRLESLTEDDWRDMFNAAYPGVDVDIKEAVFNRGQFPQGGAS